MFRKRLFSGLSLLLFNIVVIIFSKNIFLIELCFMSIISMNELFALENFEHKILAKISYVLVCMYYCFIKFNILNNNINFIFVILVILAIVFVIMYPKYNIKHFLFSFATIFYTTIMTSFLYLIRAQILGKWLIWIPFISAWGCDTMAYCFGSLIGKRSLCKELSSKKTVEGLISGIISVLIIGFIYFIFMIKYNNLPFNYLIKYSFFIVICAFISQIGDLIASGIKREYKIKDFGKIIPGHGGIIDRFDSIIFVAPICYILFT